MAEFIYRQAEEKDPYVAQLQEMFESCDSEGDGVLGHCELRELCRKLQLEEEAETLIHHLLGSDVESKVDFAGFRVGIVNFLADTMLEMNPMETVPRCDTATSTEYKHWSVREKSGNKKVQKNLERSSNFSDDDVSSFIGSGSENSNLKNKTNMSGNNPRNSDLYEAEGECSTNLVDNSMAISEEEEHIREIWKTLGLDVTKDLTMHDLGKVCDHIGMDMSPQELEQLFSRLDGDGDGRITFEEFHEGLFQHGLSANQNLPVDTSFNLVPLPHTPQNRRRSRGLTPLRSHDDSFRALTPITPSANRSGIFSAIDVDNTGCCSLDELIENWESIGVGDGEEVLMGLGLGSQSKISLLELSFLLTQEIAGSADQNSTFRAAFLSYQQELSHCRGLIEQITAEKVKFRQDLMAANSRNELLVKEADERHLRLEQSTENQIINIEQKYHDQVKMLQALLEEEREANINQSARLRQNYEDKIEGLKHEECRVKENLISAQLEIEKLERDVSDLMEQLEENETVTIQLKRELQSANDLQQSLLDGQYPEEFSNGKQQQLLSENKILRDKVDELSADVERLKQDLVSVRCSSIHRPDSPTSSPTNKRRRQLSTEYLTSEESVEEAPMSPRNNQSESETKLFELVQELELMKKNAEEERKDIEQVFKMEIVEIEERHDKEKDKLLKSFEQEKEKLKEDLEKSQQEALAELERTLQNDFAVAKQDIIQKYESEKNYMEHKFTEERQRLESSSGLKEESHLKESLNSEENGKDRLILLDRFLKEKRELEERHDQEKTKIYKEVECERKHLIDQYEEEKSHLKETISSQNRQLEDALEKHVANQAKLREVTDLLSFKTKELKDLKDKVPDDNMRQKLIDELREKLAQEIQEETEEAFVAQIQKIRRAFDEERQVLENSTKAQQHEMDILRQSNSTHQKQSSQLQDQLDDNRNQLNLVSSERDKVTSDLSRTRKQLYDLQVSHQSLLEEIKLQQTQTSQKEKDLYGAQHGEKLELQSKLAQLELDMSKLVAENASLKVYQSQYKESVKAKEVLEGRIQSAENSIKELTESANKLSQSQLKEKELLQASLEEKCVKLKAALENNRQLTEKPITSSDNISVGALTELQIQLREVEGRARESANQNKQLQEETKLALLNCERLYKHQVESVEIKNTDLSTKLEGAIKAVDEMTEKYKEQCKRSIRSDVILKQLNQENDRLSEALFITETRQKQVEEKYYNMAERCQAFQAMACRVARAGVSR